MHLLPWFAVPLLAGPLTATDYWVSGLRGKDTNAGSVQAPFRTLTKATRVARANDRIRVLPGRYSPTLGEAFPISVPPGVDLIGQDPRTCVIDAEYDPTSTNNKVKGTLVRLADKTRFAYVSVVNAPRTPSNPGKHWWNMAIHVEGPSGDSSNIEIDHVILDNVSRGIVCGFASGDHQMKNILIHNCVLQRFYVEGINSWIKKGSATGNLVTNCTVLGHMRQAAPIKPYGRACLSFGENAQFDVRNCVIVRGDWAGIEAHSTAKVTSDANCLLQAPYRGVKAGAKDLAVDPKLAVLPALQAAADPHQTSFLSPIWRKGLNAFAPARPYDIDYRSPRVQAGTVDIGCDEFGGNDAWFVDPVRRAKPTRIGCAGSGSTPAILAIGFRAFQSGVTVPGFGGKLWLDPSLPIVLQPVARNAAGYVSITLVMPNLALEGLELDLQSIDLKPASFSDLDRIVIIN